MSVASLLSKARAMGVRLILHGDGVKLRGPADSIAALKPELAAHKSEIVEYPRREDATRAAILRVSVNRVLSQRGDDDFDDFE